MMVDKEEMLLRELAGGRCVIPKVTAELGPMSLWSKDGLEAEIRRAVQAEREACAKEAEDSDHVVGGRGYYDQLGDADATVRNIVAAIRARRRA